MSHVVEAVWLLGQQLGIWQVAVVFSLFFSFFIIPVMVKRVVASVKIFMGVTSLKVSSLMFNICWACGGRWLATERTRSYLSYKERDPHTIVHYGTKNPQWMVDPETGEVFAP